MSTTTRRRTRLLAVTGLAGLALAAAPGPASSPAVAEPAPERAVDQTTVFDRGQDGYHTFRIPAVVQAADGTLLAFAEGRINSPGDDGDIDLVLKRSADGGVTWGPLQVVVDGGGNKFGNPVPILDERTGRVVLNVTRTGGDVSGDDIRCGRADAEQTRRSFVLYSDDHGASWSAPVEITADVKPADWRHFVGGPGHGIQITQGEHAGRLVIPGNHSAAPPPGSGLSCTDDRLFGAHSLYSDDGGTTWHLGGVDTTPEGVVNPNENTVVELSDGSLYFNARDQNGTSVGARASTTSADGGASFDAPYQEIPDLVAPVVQGSILALSREADRRERLVFAAPGHPTSRENLTLWSSFDDAGSWVRGPVVYEGPAGYSDIVQIDGHGRARMLGVLYENGDRLHEGPELTYHQRISFARVIVPTLDAPAPPPPTTPDVSGNGLDAVVSGTPRRVGGVVGSGLDLAGDYVETPADPALEFGAGPFTAAAWFRTGSSVVQTIVWAHSNRDVDPKWWVRLEPDLGRIRAHVNTGERNTFVSAPGDFADGRWHHVALTRDDDAVTLYVDGEPLGSSAPVAGSVSAGALTGIRIGSRVDGINNPLDGAVDDVWMFDQALGAAEIAALADGHAPAGAEPVLHLPLDRVTR
ncbi:sialidase family protein [Jiangella alkaliphila]|uniref:exo-alpha-sialidase n=1 Tax=Jiangella alkaliphila TaxID=419479 RepID=A0A1H2LAL6_9ACTN|nr:sialidase family protein [Jiangella alkaliphila]SDU78077.1 sialidase-1 [Jiangella alkaliphila]